MVLGGAEGNRTPDLCSAIAALSHLSYGPAVGLAFRWWPPALSRNAGCRPSPHVGLAHWAPTLGIAGGGQFPTRRVAVAICMSETVVAQPPSPVDRRASPLVAGRPGHYTRGPPPVLRFDRCSSCSASSVP